MSTYRSWARARPFFFPLSNFLGTERLCRPHSPAIPNSRKPRKSSPNASAKLPLLYAPSQIPRQRRGPVENVHDEFRILFLIIFIPKERIVVDRVNSGLLRSWYQRSGNSQIRFDKHTTSRYAPTSFFSSSVRRDPYRITSSVMYRSRSRMCVVPLSKSV